MILLYDVVEIFGLTQFNLNIGIGIDTANGSSVGTTLVDGDLFRQTMQVNGALQLAPCSSMAPLGGVQTVHRVATFVDGAVQILLLACNFDVGLIHPPASSHCALTAMKNERHDG